MRLLILLLFSFAFAFAFAAAATPRIDSTSVIPLGIATGTASQVTVVAKITDPSLIPTSVNLVRLGSSGSQPAILGALHDDGQAGDLVAGDNLYTFQVTFNEASAGQIQLQVSAAFRGQLRRVASKLFLVMVTTPVSLPPDPGPAGMITLQGIDSDNDGVRDDIQRFIALSFPSSAKVRAALTQITVAAQSLILDSTNAQNAEADMVNLNRGLECSAATVGVAETLKMFAALRGQIVNTLPRLQAYFAAEAQFSGHTYTLTPQAQQIGSCTTNPNTLPN